MGDWYCYACNEAFGGMSSYLNHVAEIHDTKPPYPSSVADNKKSAWDNDPDYCCACNNARNRCTCEGTKEDKIIELLEEILKELKQMDRGR